MYQAQDFILLFIVSWGSLEEIMRFVALVT